MIKKDNVLEPGNEIIDGIKDGTGRKLEKISLLRALLMKCV